MAATEALTGIDPPQGKAGVTNVRVDANHKVVHSRREEYVRIDTQGYANNDTCYNVQCQSGERSMAGVIFPIGLPLDEIRRGLLLAIANNAMYTWYPDEGDGSGKTDGATKDNNKRGNNRKPPKGGGGGGGRGNNFATTTPVSIATQ